MKIHLEPRVLLIWRPALVAEGIKDLLTAYGCDGVDGWRRDHGDGDGDGIPELYGRMCYSSFGDLQGRIGAKTYHANILENGHGSVLETATWGFAVLGASRGHLAQITRHRAGFAWAAESTHFTKYAEEGRGTVEPALCLAGIPAGPAREFMIQECAASLKAYERLWEIIRATLPADAKVKKIVSGAARGMLPTAIECRIGFTANARALRHFCETRGTPENTVEIRLVAAGVAGIMMGEAPAIFQDFTIATGDDGWPTVTSGHRKV